MNVYKFQTQNICISKGWDKLPIESVWLLLTEEFGELASAIRKYRNIYSKNSGRRKHELYLEFGDVMSYLFHIAYILDLDLDYMWSLHIQKLEHKNYFNN